jgi:hypothetical protein
MKKEIISDFNIFRMSAFKKGWVGFGVPALALNRAERS